MKTTRSENLHLRVDAEFKAQIEAAAAKLDIPPAAYMRMALREYIARHEPDALRETGPGYNTAPPSPPGGDTTTARNRAVSTAARTSFYAITREK